MKHKNSKTRENFLKKLLLRMVALVLMVLAPLQLMAAPVIISTTADPTLIGTQNTVGAMALWENAGTIDGVSIDLRATITAIDGGTVAFTTDLDDPTLKLTPTSYLTTDEYVTVKWEIFISGTNQTVAAVGTPTVGIVDIDGDLGSDTIEAISTSLTDLSGYIVDDPTNLQVDVAPDLLHISGTQEESYGPESLVILNYNEVSSWDITYYLYSNNYYTNAIFYNDLDGDETLTDPKNEVVFLTLDLDDDNSTATGNDYADSYLLGTTGVVIADIDTNITQDVSLGTDLGSATITLTNAQANDLLTIGTLPAGITGTVDTSVSGVITVTLTGTATVSDYETALQAITFSNNDKTANLDDRVFEFSVTNETYGVSSDTAISTIAVGLDTDGDGISDDIDLDDDNDGILDVDEQSCIVIGGSEFDGTFGTLDPTTRRDLQTAPGGIYTYLPSGQGLDAGDYAVLSTDLQTDWHPAAPANFVGHTTGQVNDAFLAVNGGTSVGTFFSDTINTSTNQDVSISFWATSWSNSA